MRKRRIFTWGIITCVVLTFLTITTVKAANTTDQIIAQIDDILKANPLKAGDKVQMINVIQDGYKYR